MNNGHPIDQTITAEQRACAEWESLLGRLNGGDPAEGRLQLLRRAIASGEFHIDAKAIADRLIARLLTS